MVHLELTTLKDKHAEIKRQPVENFVFVVRKVLNIQYRLKSHKLAKIVQNCRDIPGKELFQYIDEEGNRQSIDSGMVNEYIASWLVKILQQRICVHGAVRWQL